MDKSPDLDYGCHFSGQLPPSDWLPSATSDPDLLSTQQSTTQRRNISHQPHPPSQDLQITERESSTSALSSSPPLEQLARRLRQQSLAAKARPEYSPPSLFPQSTPWPALEVDPEEDLGGDSCKGAMFRHYRESLLGVQPAQVPSNDTPNDPSTADIRAKLNADITKMLNAPAPSMGPVMSDHKSGPIEADPSIADEGFDEPMLSESSALQVPWSMTGGFRKRRELGFRTSLEAASSCRLVVCKTPRMRRRTKVPSKKTTILPTEGAKGAEAAAQICDLS